MHYDMGGNYDFPNNAYTQLSLAASIGQVILGGVTLIMPLFFTVIVCALGLVKLKNFLKKRARLQAGVAGIFRLKTPDIFWNRLIILLAVFAFLYLITIQATGSGRLPHVPDAVAYMFQAKTFAGGKLFAETPVNPESFPVPGIINYQGRQFSQYNFGHPLLLSAGYIMNAPWIIPPLLASCSLLLLYLLGKFFFSAKAGFLAALLLLLSPFFQMNAIDFMSHNTALFFTLLFAWSFLKLLQKRTPVFSLAAGLALGMLINTRPYTAFFISLPFFLLALWDLLKNRSRIKKIIFSYLPFFAVLLFFLFTLLAYNQALTGDALKMPYALGFIDTFGFSLTRPVSYGLMDVFANLVIFDKIVFGMAGGGSFVFILIWLFSGKKNKYTLLCLGAVISIVLGYFWYKGPWMTYGPRMWLEALPFFILLTIAGLKTTILFLSGIFPQKNRRKLQPFFTIMLLLFSGFFLLGGTIKWLSTTPTEESVLEFTPHNLGELPDFNFANDHLVNKIAQLGITNAVVFIDKQQDWWSYGIPSFSADFSLQGNIVYAVDLGKEKNLQVMKMYPGRKYYQANYDTAEISSYQL